VVVNRILPPDVDGHFAAWRMMQQEYAPMVEEMFAPLPILRAPHFPREIIGPQLLAPLADLLYGESDPAAFLYQGPVQRVEKTAQGFDLLVPLPFVSEDEVHLAQSADELLISVGWHRHRVVLPQSLSRLRAQDAFFEEDILRVVFTHPQNGSTRPEAKGKR
jgi:arsenite-transporting ATPase